MIGGFLPMLRAKVAAAMLSARLALSRRPPPPAPRPAVRPRAATVKSGERRPPRRDGARQAAAQAKRERKNAKRWRDWWRCFEWNDAARSAIYPAGVHHGS